MSRKSVLDTWLSRGLGTALGMAVVLNAWAGNTAIGIGNASVTVTGPNNVTMNFPITRTGDLSYDAYVNYRTANGTAIGGLDYTTTVGSFRLSAGVASMNLPVAVMGSSANFSDKRFGLQLLGTSDSGPAFSLAAAQTFPVGTGPSNMATADLNGDGQPDLIVTTSATSQFTVSVLLNTAVPGSTSPSYAAPQIVLENSLNSYSSITTADVNGDGKPDIITLDQNAQTVTVLLNTTVPGASIVSFSAPETLTTSLDGAFYLKAADLNGDGKPDLVLSAPCSGCAHSGISVFVNTAPIGATTVTFAPEQFIDNGDDTNDFNVADINGDGTPDIIVISGLSGASYEVIFNSTPTGATTLSFTAPQNFSIGFSAFALGLADLNGDGLPDLVLTDFSGNSAVVSLNTTAAGSTTASFSAPQTFATGTHPASVVVTDVNGDGIPDLVVINGVGNTLSVLLNNTAPGATTPNFATQQIFSVSSPAAITVTDINGDGLPDVVVADFGNNTVSVLTNGTTPPSPVAPVFAAPQGFSVGFVTSALGLADFNGDDRPDLALANFTGNSVVVLLNTIATGSSTASFAAPQTFATGAHPNSVVPADVNSDGIPDLVVSSQGANTVSVLLNSTSPGATAPSFAGQQVFAINNPIAIAMTDINGDTLPDVIAADFGSNTASVLINTTMASATTASFASAQAFPAGTGPRYVVTVDLNGDEEPDLVVTTDIGSQHTVSVLLNTATSGASSPSYGTPQAVLENSLRSYTSVTTADVNGDGKPDIIALDQSTQTVTVLLNTTAAGASVVSFSAPETLTTLGPAAMIKAVDLNGDGKPDLIVSTPCSGCAYTGLSVFVNTTPAGATTAAFAPEQPIDNANLTDEFDVADINGDGTPDIIAITGLSGASYEVLFNNTSSVSLISSSATGTIYYNVPAPQVSLSTADVSFGSYQMGTTSPVIVVTLTNTGSANLSGINLSISGVSAGDFSESNDCPTVVSYTPGDNSCTINLTFTPSALGSRTGNLVITSNASSSPDNVTLTGNGSDIAATAINGNASTTADHAVNGTVTATPGYSGQTNNFGIVSSPSHGSISITNSSTGAFTYTPTTGYAGSDSFTFKTTDAYGTASNTATESVTVNDVAPTATGTCFRTAKNTAHSGTLSATVAYSGQTLTFSAVTGPGHGSLSITGSTGAFTYTPATNYTGADSFTFKVTDSHGTSSNTATETIKVGAIICGL